MLTDQQRYQGLSADLRIAAGNLLRALQRRDNRGAAALLDTLSASAATHPEVLRLRAAYDFFARSNPALALESLLQALPQRQHDALIYHLLGECYENLHDSMQALKAYECACNEGPEQPQFWFDFARVLTYAGWNADATLAFQQVVKLSPNHQRARGMLASALNMEGRADEAAAQYRKMLATDPRSGVAWWGLAVLKPLPLDADDVQTMRAALANPAVDAGSRTSILFALAAVLEAQHDYAGVMTSLREAHALASKAGPPWDADANREELERTLEAFADVQPAHPEDLGREVIFIVSLPRSGSTLVEQILASHSQVTGTTELPDLMEIIGAASREHGAPLWAWASSMDRDGWRGLGEAYLKRTARWRTDTPCFTDKMTANWRYADALLAMLPNARVVMVRRDPLENCLACYRMLLPGLEYAHDFEHLAQASQQYDNAIETLRSRYPRRVRLQRYEALTADPDGEIRALLDFCELPFEQACIDFHATKRRVTTPSAAQVRQPMRRDTARADKYGALLDPLREALGLPPFDAGDTA